ncbi:MAG TPA: YciI family protein [Thermoanaerobaculia bacterium]|jgi:hypothetical protein
MAPRSFDWTVEADVKFLMLIHYDERAYEAIEDKTPILQECGRVVEDVARRGQFLAAAQLHPTTTATSVRVRGGKRRVTDGPFAETREQLAGFLLVDAANLDDAIAIAGTLPPARFGTIEVRPILEDKGETR